MVTEKVQEIKRAEEKADAIIRRAEDKAGGIAASLEKEVNDLRNVKEQQLAAETKKYRGTGDKKAEESIALLRQEYLHRAAGIKEKSERKITGAVDSAWKELKVLLSMP